MSEKIDAVLQQMTELVDAVKTRGGTQEMNEDGLVARFSELLIEQKKQILDEMPVRKGELPIGVDRAVDAYQGKYTREVRGIAKDGCYGIGSWKLRASDLWMAKHLLERANAFKAQGMVFQGSEGVKPVSADLGNAVKALTATGAATGDELVPTGMASELWQDFFSASRVGNDLPNQPMPTDPFDIPLSLGDVTWRKGTQNTATTASDTATAKSTLTSTEEVAEVDWSYNLEEDAVVAMMPALRKRLALSGGEAIDAFCLNADSTDASTGNINLDDADPDADSYYLSNGQDGIRHLAIVDHTDQKSDMSGALTDAGMTTLLGLLAKYGLDYQNVRIVPDIHTYFDLVGLTNVATFDKYGPQATIVTGELARYRGVPVIPSASMGRTEADGKLAAIAGSNTKGQIVAYNRNSWVVGFRRGLMIEVDRLIQKRQLVMVVSFRIAIGAYGTRSSAEHTACLYNIT
jgi:HK97 family phage major capsid protein